MKRLALPINSHIEQVRSALNKNINFENLDQEIKTLTFLTNSAGQPITTTRFTSNLSKNIQGIMVVRTIITSDNTSFPSELPIISWSQEGNLVTITNIGGLLPETEYSLTVLTL